MAVSYKKLWKHPSSHDGEPPLAGKEKSSAIYYDTVWQKTSNATQETTF